MKIYILQTHNGQFLNKDLEWTSEVDTNALFRTPHRDVALNQLIELNAKDTAIRAGVVECAADSKGRPILPEEVLATESKSAANCAELTEKSGSEQSDAA